eukprot:CAMPEP_0171096916 /NCGR_PEP_ID=MMETSP0766_2-20121228/46297_1 /TAXON_ID=439317 /ORGANISM="Gambierdiscus australes, Strain CAWD 149" /LENGTH=134 /DNA_ID=CAMNT_0011556003 /DNA_START=85 /DNA_END=486 /DNA_ORIENTATION=-
MKITSNPFHELAHLAAQLRQPLDNSFEAVLALLSHRIGARAYLPCGLFEGVPHLPGLLDRLPETSGRGRAHRALAPLLLQLRSSWRRGHLTFLLTDVSCLILWRGEQYQCNNCPKHGHRLSQVGKVADSAHMFS